MQLRHLHLAERGRNVKTKEARIAPQGARLEPARGFPKPALAVFRDGRVAKLSQRQALPLLSPLLRAQLVFERSRLLFGRAEIAMAHEGSVIEIDHPSSGLLSRSRIDRHACAYSPRRSLRLMKSLIESIRRNAVSFIS